MRKSPLFWLETQVYAVIFGVLFQGVWLSGAVDVVYLKFALILAVFFAFLGYFVVESRPGLQARCRFAPSDVRHAGWVSLRRKLRSGQFEQALHRLETQKGSSTRIFYHKRVKYYYDEQAGSFRKVKPALHCPVERLMQAGQALFPPESLQLLDRNELVFPLPDFVQLLRQQLMEPLQFFQIFSALLWVFDNGFYQPMFMVGLLLVSNASACLQRLGAVLALRGLRTPAYWVNVRVGDGFERRSSVTLRPGDVVQLQRSSDLVAVEAEAEDELEELRGQLPFGQLLPAPVLERLLGLHKAGQAQAPSQPRPQHTADLLLRTGTAVVDESILTGESVPQAKEPVPARRGGEAFARTKHHSALIFAGCDVLAAGAPDAPAEAVVVAIGFGTVKGKIARMVLAGEEPTVEGRRDAYVLLGLLLLVALFASGYVLLTGLADAARSREKLFLRCIAIVTNVVPPELPMIMSMAVNSSLAFLRTKRIFCTEPHRIPAAGRVRTCVFDKTGTLTEERLELCGWADAAGGRREGWALPEAQAVVAVLLGCHALFELDGKLVGDPIEKLFFELGGFAFNARTQTASVKGAPGAVTQRRVFPFSPELRRMAVVAEVRGLGAGGPQLLVKGAPEAVLALLAAPDPRLGALAEALAAEGFRVLGLARRPLTAQQALLEREEIERELTFAGFLLLRNPLKADTAVCVQRLMAADRRVLVLTGDHLLTSAQTFLALRGPGQPLLVASPGPAFTALDGGAVGAQESGSTQYVMTADDAVKMLEELPAHAEVLARAAVIARASPAQKEQIVRWLQRSEPVLMCGDGTNDAGALRAAAVGIALVGTQAAPTRAEKAAARTKREDAMRRAWAERRLPRPEELQPPEPEEAFKLGDASIAAPFTNKHSNSVKCVETVLRQGLSTLVSGLQSYKTATLASLMLAYSMSSLHLHNLRFSDAQNLALGVYTTYLYYILSNGKPVKRLPRAAADPSIFTVYFWLSLLGQAAIQLLCLARVMRFALQYAPEGQRAVNNEAEFVPTFVNTCMFLFELASTFSIWVFNYEGRPFMQALSETRHFKFIALGLLLIPTLALDAVPELSAAFGLRFESAHPNAANELGLTLGALLLATFGWTRLVAFLRLGRLEKWI